MKRSRKPLARPYVGNTVFLLGIAVTRKGPVRRDRNLDPGERCSAVCEASAPVWQRFFPMLPRVSKPGMRLSCLIERRTLAYCAFRIRSRPMLERNFSAIAAMRTLRGELRDRPDQNEDYRAWKALDHALRELEPPSLPQPVEFL